ncbi:PLASMODESMATA CALLOSE-BINDING PROTEIN 2 [Cynara cardunculus var. scolymus]|uniref:X8-like protein n=1 Tax=Cynara cardunculus var. scolymus TaxID=59895 RepID=A0A118JZ57_CYNCS|nr:PLASMODESMATA CALLOSE-BINDING PROTEIN 2 [Cynara cardunculus var. scolymus]KVH99281.1 X8-like protein [Cynara cardunculus var. scolymus]
MAVLVVFMLILSMAAQSSGNWCVCKKGGQDKVLQEAIDYACGNGADCTQTHQGGKCFNPDTVIDHCNYAVNSYFQNKGQTPGTCDFKGATMVVTTDPSSNGCTFPSTASRTTGSTSPTTNTGTTSSPGSTSTSSFGNNPSNNGGMLGGGMGGGLGPSASSMDTDVSHGVGQETNILGLLLGMVGAGVVVML